MTWKQRRFLALLGLPAFGISLAYTVVTTYLPVLIEQISGPAVTGILIGGEGLLALFVPIIIGGLSDSLRTRLGGRMPFMLAGAALAVISLVLMPFGGNSLSLIGISLVLFFVAYFAYYPPYYALFPDLVPEEMHGRSQGAQGMFRSAGMLLSLAGGGVLLALWQPLPFLIGALAISGVTAFFLYEVRNQLGQHQKEERPRNEQTNWELVRDNPNIRLWLFANALLEGALAVLRVFVVLYLTQGLGLSLAGVSGALALVGIAALAAAPLSGRLADSYGHRPVMLVSMFFFGLGLIVPLFTTNTYFLVGILPAAFAAVTLLTLPYAVLMGLLPRDENHGVGAGLFLFSRGLGVVIGPLLAGILVELFEGVEFLTFDATQGYAAIFLIATAFLLSSTPFFLKMNAEERRRDA